MYTTTRRQYRHRPGKRISKEYIRARNLMFRKMMVLAVTFGLITFAANLVSANEPETNEPDTHTYITTISEDSMFIQPVFHRLTASVEYYDENSIIEGDMPMLMSFNEVSNEPIEETSAEDIPSYNQDIIEEIEPEPVLPPEDPIPSVTSTDDWVACLGNDVIEIGDVTLTRQRLPDMDYTTFQPYEDYSCITAKSSQAYKVTFSEGSYTDGNGLRRVPVPEGGFSIDGIDDYVVAMGTFYKEKGVCGIRFLVVTDVGCYTVTTGDEKADEHTDNLHMYTLHGDRHQYAAVLEWLVDTSKLPKIARQMGSVHYIPVEPINGEIQMIYRIG